MNKKVEKGHRRPINAIVILLILIVIIVCVCVYLGRQAMKASGSNAMEAFSNRYTEVSKKTAQGYYDWAYQKSEREYHVSNVVTISIGNIIEQSELQVLKVGAVEYVIQEEDNDYIAWAAIPGCGTFTVDLTRSEFLVDNARKIVIARVPIPKLTRCDILYQDIVPYYQKGGIVSRNGNYSQGVNYAEEDLKEGEKLIRQEFLSDQRYLQAAQESAKNIITDLVLSLNPEVKDLKVEVEFLD